MRYRELEPAYRDVWDWDIVLVHGDVKIIGQILEHLDDCGRGYGCGCTCLEHPTLSSPVLGENRRQLHEKPYRVSTGEGRALLGARDGTQVEVLSGKTYRLRGGRRESDEFSGASIWHVYREPEEIVSFWGRLRRLVGRSAS